MGYEWNVPCFSPLYKQEHHGKFFIDFPLKPTYYTVRLELHQFGLLTAIKEKK